MTTFSGHQQKQTKKTSSEPARSTFQPDQPLVSEAEQATPIVHRASPLDWQAEVAFAERFGHSISRLAIHGPTPATNQIIQRVVDAKTVLNVKNTTAIPDLPANEVVILDAACKDESKRQAALDALYTYLKGRGLVDEAEVDSFTYEKKTDVYGFADASKKDAKKLAVFVYSAAFDTSAPVVYSTLRHELIHVEQQRLSADTVADANDPFFYHDPSRQGGTSGSYEGNVQHAVQEIETHVWEIENAGATGITADFVKNRRDTLYTYYKDLCENAGKISFKQQQNWKGYIDKAIKMAEQQLDEKDYPRKTIGWKADPKTASTTGKMKGEKKHIPGHTGKPYDRTNNP